MNSPKISILRRFGDWLRKVWQVIFPGKNAWTGAALGLLLAGLVFALVAVIADFGGTGFLGMLIGLVVFVLGGALGALVLSLVQKLLAVLPDDYVPAIGFTLAILWLTLFVARVNLVVIMLVTLVAVSLLGAAIWSLVRGGWGRANTARRAVILVGLVLGLVGTVGGAAWLLWRGQAFEPPVNAAKLAGNVVSPLALPNPGEPGVFEVKTLTYGNGQDLLRLEYGINADLITQPVDGSKLVSGWSGLRTDYWGFGPEAMPLNGRVWYPGELERDGEGPFPIVVMVHGNHIAEYYSDPGYTYLGELFASRGYIAVSVDENFLNISPSADLAFISSLQDENDARGWLLLEHLRAWWGWNETPSNLFYRKVDLNNVALIGHSRGGEAVAIAALFNTLPRYPDDASLVFKYDFGIRAVAAIAPIDGGYHSGGRAISPQNISYFVLHGTHDMDAAVFEGRWMYERIGFSDDDFHFKSALYIYGANHGQFNTTWGQKDLVEPGMRFYNLRNLLPAEQQQQIAKVYLSAFIEAALGGETGYLPLFRDARYGRQWLPDTIFLAQYSDSQTQALCTFEEDLDVNSTTLPGGLLRGEHLESWFEQRVYVKNRNQLTTTAVYLKWGAQAGEEAVQTPLFAIRLPRQGLELKGGSRLVLTLSDASPADNPPQEAIDFTIEVVDGLGNMARLPLSSVAYLQPRIMAHIFKAPWMSEMLASEMVFQDFEFALANFTRSNPAFDPAILAEIRLVFDRTPAGTIAVDEVSIR